MEKDKEEVSEEKNETKKMSKGLKIAIIIIGIVVAIVIFVFAFKLGSNLAKVEDEILNDEEKEEENKDGEVSIGVTYIQDVKLEEVTNLPEVAKLYGEKINAGNDIVEDDYYKLDRYYGGYYIVKKNNTYYLKRNQKEIAKLEKNKYGVYKDSSDKNSKYIAVYCDNDSFSIGMIDDGDYAHLAAFDDNYTGIVYNINTGKYKVYEGGFINVIYGNDGAHYTFESEKDGSVSLVSLKDFSLIKAPKDIYVVGNGVRLSRGENYYSASSKYIVVGNSSDMEATKYGLYDYNLNKKIDLIYDDLNTISDDLLIAKKDKKYGVIDADNNTIIDFKYDGIENIDDYYVVVLDNKIGVLDKDGKEIVPIKYEAYEMNFSLRNCCSSENVFSITKKVDQIVISYVDATRENENTRYGYDISYIILNSDNTHKKVEIIDKIYNYGNEYYYYNFVGDNKLNIYNTNRELHTTLSCTSGNIYDSGFEFADKKHVEYSCSTEDGPSTTHYYNVVEKKDAKASDIDVTYKDSVDSTGEVYVYLVNGKHEVYSNEYELLMTIEKEDKLLNIYDNYYKLTLKDGTIKYYELKGTTWN